MGSRKAKGKWKSLWICVSVCGGAARTGSVPKPSQLTT